MLVASWLLVTARAAHADILPPDAKSVAYSYELESKEPISDHVLVLWPRACMKSGEPLGAATPSSEGVLPWPRDQVDYEVLSVGTKLHLFSYCAPSIRIYALPAAAFPRVTRTAPSHDYTLGTHEGDAIVHLPALDAIDLSKRKTFFDTDARLVRSPFTFDVVARVSRSISPLKAVHDVIAVDTLDPTTLKLTPKRAIYTYEDGTSETLPYATATRPPPSRPNALASPGSPAPSFAPVPDAGAPTAVSPSSPAPKDRGTRWVYLAAVAGLLVGALLAWHQRRNQRR